MSTIHVIGAGLAGLAAALSCARAGTACRRVRTGTGGWRPLPLVFRPRPRRADRQRQPPAALRQRVDDGVSRRGRRAGHPDRAGPGEFRVHGHRHRRALAAGAGAQRHPVVGAEPPPPRSRHAAARLHGVGGDAPAPRRSRAAPSRWPTRSAARRCTAGLIEPLAVSALNTRPEIARVALLARVMAESMELGGHACVPCFPRVGLSESFIDPAVGADPLASAARSSSAVA